MLKSVWGRMRRWGFGFHWTPAAEQPIPEEKIRPLAQRLAKQRPWRSAEENWLAAEQALRQRPWRPWVIQFSGEKERSGWDWAELSLKVSVPVLIVALGTGLNRCTAVREERLARQQRRSDVVTTFIKEMQALILADRLVPGKEGTAKENDEKLVLPRELTLAALFQLGSDVEIRYKGDEVLRFVLQRDQVLRFVRGLGLHVEGGKLLEGADMSHLNLIEVNLEFANLGRAILNSADLRGAYLLEADLKGAFLVKADLRGADLRGADLSEAHLWEADLSEADLRGADLGGVKWNARTKWPEPVFFEGARNIPEDLKKQLGL